MMNVNFWRPPASAFGSVGVIYLLLLKNDNILIRLQEKKFKKIIKPITHKVVG